MKVPFVYVVILGWNCREDTAECVASALDMDYPAFRTLVVDNGSTDGAPEYLKERFPSLEMIENEENLGIARGYNTGIEYALRRKADYVLLLNNDTVLDVSLLRELVEAAEAEPQAGVLMPKIYYHGDGSRLWSAGARRRFFPPGIVFIGLNKDDGPSYARQRRIDYAPSCGLLIRRGAFEEVGLFDPGYFFYYDDWDFSERVRRAGYTILYVPRAKMWHKVSLSTRKRSQPAKWWRILGQSSVRFHLKFSRTKYLSLMFHTLWIVLREIVQGNAKVVPAYLGGVVEMIQRHLAGKSTISSD